MHTIFLHYTLTHIVYHLYIQDSKNKVDAKKMT